MAACCEMWRLASRGDSDGVKGFAAAACGRAGARRQQRDSEGVEEDLGERPGFRVELIVANFTQVLPALRVHVASDEGEEAVAAPLALNGLLVLDEDDIADLGRRGRGWEGAWGSARRKEEQRDGGAGRAEVAKRRGRGPRRARQLRGPASDWRGESCPGPRRASLAARR